MIQTVELLGISKRYGAISALDDVNLTATAGSIHAIVGENGAGKTTLMKILYGASAPDAGEIRLDGRRTTFHSSAQAIASGIGMVSQHYGIIGELTCLQNLILGAELGAWLNPRQNQERAEALAEGMGFRFPWNSEAAILSPAQAQKLEILKLLWRKAHVLILDEPTAMLSPEDGDALFGNLQALAQEGRPVFLVTHRIDEVRRYCETVTVLRGGKRVASLKVSETTNAELARMIVGGEVLEPDCTAVSPGSEALRLEDVTVRGNRGNDAVQGVSFQIRQGEVVGIAGVDGSGQRELAEFLMGLRPALSGAAKILGRDGGATCRQRLQDGMQLIPEDRLSQAIIADWSLNQNSALGRQWMPPFADRGRIEARGTADATLAIANRFDTQFRAIGQRIGDLSGGNQQRFVAARALFDDPTFILAFQPARGLDLNSTTRVYRAIRETCQRGGCSLIISFDLDELLVHCDRILVMNGGRLTAPPTGKERDRHEIGRLMVRAH